MFPINAEMQNSYTYFDALTLIDVAEKVVTSHLLGKCRRFLAQNPILNVLTLGDSYSPLLGVSTLYTAVENSQVVGVCAVYHAFSKPSVVLAASKTKIKNDLLKTALMEVSDEFISLCQPDEIEIFKNHSSILQVHFEQQMIANPPKQIRIDSTRVTRVSEGELGSLDEFYREHQAEAWTPLQFKVGPFYCVKQDGKMVSAAGTHVRTPQIAHLGNIVTDEAYRNRGFATACTSILAANLASKGRIISLFVRNENQPAIQIYEKLGFRKKREIAFITAQKEN
jgi:ribosomal protein S18 acetylase RimI-like enzyme